MRLRAEATAARKAAAAATLEVDTVRRSTAAELDTVRRSASAAAAQAADHLAAGAHTRPLFSST
jgi:hypothetical protein